MCACVWSAKSAQMKKCHRSFVGCLATCKHANASSLSPGSGAMTCVPRIRLSCSIKVEAVSLACIISHRDRSRRNSPALCNSTRQSSFSARSVVACLMCEHEPARVADAPREPIQTLERKLAHFLRFYVGHLTPDTNKDANPATSMNHPQ